MKTTLDHLPEEKRYQINAIANEIVTLYKPEKVILFGSYARGNYVEDIYVEDGITFEYKSDYDILIILNDDSVKTYEIQSRIQSKFRRFRIDINILSHNMEYVNHGLMMGQYFFTEIINDGILLFDNRPHVFAEPKILTNWEQAEMIKHYYENWFPQAEIFLKIAKFCKSEGDLKIGAFNLHQAAESLYNTLLLIYNGYKPKTHNLENLTHFVKVISKEIYQLFSFPKDNITEMHLFDLLKRGYVDARYNKDYYITESELTELIRRTEKMKDLVHQSYLDRLSSLI